jgi:hypothetical protein
MSRETTIDLYGAPRTKETRAVSKQGLRGERTEERHYARPEQRRAIKTEQGAVIVEDQSGVAFAEAKGAAAKAARPPKLANPLGGGRQRGVAIASVALVVGLVLGFRRARYAVFGVRSVGHPQGGI